MLNKGFLLILLAVSVLYACKGRRKKHRETPPVVRMENDSMSAKASAADLLSSTLKTWTYFSAKIDVELRYGEGKKFNPNASIRMYKDSLIWLSGGLFGIEGLRVLINKDSVVMINKLEKTYTVYKNNAFKGISDIPLTVTQLQNLIIAKPVYALELYEILLQNENRLAIAYNQEKFKTQHSFQKQFLTIDTTSIRDKSTPNFAEARYSEYSVVNGHNFPSFTFITATSGQKIYEIELRYSDTDFETALTFPFTIPASYEKTK